MTFFFFLRFILRGAERDFSNLSSLKSLMSCRKQHLIFITKVETGVAVQNQNISVELYPHVDKMTQFFDVFASIDRERQEPLPEFRINHILLWLIWCGLG